MLNMDEITVSQRLQEPLISVMDYAAALDHLDGDTELLADMAILFLEESAQQLSAIRMAVVRADALALQRAAHRLKGAVANFAAEEALNAVVRLENIAYGADLREADLACSELGSALQRLNAALHAIAYA
jgi:HPt (histidine-containing phosphotransfer) domain-containing protein